MAITFKQLREEGKHTTHIKDYSVNVNLPERLVSVFAGSLLFASAVRNMFNSPKWALTEATVGGFLLLRGTTGNCPLYRQLGRDTNKIESINIKQSLIVNKPREEVYDFWRNLENLPYFMKHLSKVLQSDDKHSHWEVKLPGNIGPITWNAEIVKEVPNHFIGWRSISGSMIENAGKVEFRDALNGAGTEIQAVISYHAPAGALGTTIAKLINPMFEKLVRQDILNFKHYFEVGEIPITADFFDRME
jgi:uncharacterized membrane protein